MPEDAPGRDATPPAIALDGVYKRFGAQRALDGVSFRIDSGQVVGFVGVNGSGKTTTLRIISGFLDPDEGRVQVAGYDVGQARSHVRSMIGYMPENTPLYRDMRVHEYLRFRARLRGLSRKRTADRVEATCTECGLDGQQRRVIGHLSKGYRQRVGLADALLSEPSILLLDEPTSGLDPMQVREFRALVSGLATSRTVMISSHILSQLELVAERLLVMSAGRVVGDGDVDALRAQCGMSERDSLEDVFVALSDGHVRARDDG